MKKTLLLVLVLAACVFIIGCKTTAPSFYYNDESKNYTILGEVAISEDDALSVANVTSTKKGLGFIDLLAAAKAKYPDCDYVIDVMVDVSVTNYLIIKIPTYKMRGTAIKYN